MPRLESMDRGDIEGLQLRKLQRQVSRFAERNPFYRGRWTRAGVAPDDIRSLDDLRRLPFVSKLDVIEDQELHPPYGDRLGVPLDQIGEMTETSGTSGKGKEQHGHTVRDMALRGQFTSLGWAWAGMRPDDIAIFHIPATNSASLYSMLRGIRTVGRLPYLVGHLGFQERLDIMQAHGVNAMYITPSGLNGLSALCTSLGINPREAFPGLRFAMVSAESWPVEWVLRMEELWGMRITEVYGSTQLNSGFGASCCENGAVVHGQRGKQHLFEWTCLYEVIDPVTLEHVGPGESGELVITHLDKESSPLMRFRSGDRVTFEPYGNCDCGRQTNLIEAGTIGRVDDMLKVKGATIWPSEVDVVVFAHPEIGEYQSRVFISEKRRDEIELQYATKSGLSDDSATLLSSALTDELKRLTSVTFRVSRVEQQELPRYSHPDKKPRRFTDDRHAGLAKES
jgi:phenylacetate-CoA ligase